MNADYPSLITREPVFDDALDVVGYELIARDPRGDGRLRTDTGAARVLVQGVLAHGLDALTSGKRAHLRVTRDLLLDGHMALLPAEAVTIRLAGSVPADADVASAIADLRAQGYAVALGGFLPGDPRAALLDVVDSVTVDFRALRGGVRRAALAAVPRRVGVVAERVDSHADFLQAFDLGCAAAQGLFFAEPAPVGGTTVPGFKPLHLQLLKATQQSELAFDELEALIKRDLQLTHQFLRYVNAAAFGWRRRVDSLQHALVLLGEGAVRKWITLVLLADLASDHPQQVAVTACVRARFCELLGAAVRPPLPSDDLFMVGMLSMLDAILGRPRGRATRDLSLPPAVEAALAGADNSVRRVLDAVLAYENADWDELSAQLVRLAVDEEAVLELYLSAVDWAAAVFDLQAEPAA